MPPRRGRPGTWIKPPYDVLLSRDGVLDKRGLARITAARADAIPTLMRILADRGLHDDVAPGGGWAPIHAVDLLAEMVALEAIPLLLEVMMEGQPEELLFERIAVRLSDLGPAILEPCMAAIATLDDDPELPSYLIDALTSCGARDPRIPPLIRATLAEWVELGASYAASYGDPELLEDLKRAFDATLVQPSTVRWVAAELSELERAITTLGGSLDQRQRHKQIVAQTMARDTQPDEHVSSAEPDSDEWFD